MEAMKTHYNYFSNEEGDGYEVYSQDYPYIKGFGETYEEAIKDLEKNLHSHLSDIESKYNEKESFLEEAIKAYDAKHYTIARKIWEEYSETNADAMVNLGTLYVKGLGVERDLLKAKELFERASEAGHEVASFYLGGMYENGIGTEPDLMKSLFYYDRSAQGGMSGAQLKLGILLRNTDIFNSMKWMIKAAHAGEAQAHSLLTYVSNQTEASDINVAFRSLDTMTQRDKIEALIKDELSPILSNDGGGVELVNYIPGETPQIWLRYLGACSGCHLGPTSTAGMILEYFERLIDQKIVIYLW